MFTGVKQLPSGYWSAWINGDWIDAAALTQEDAERVLTEYIKQMQGRRH